jgi:hypothetical protein
MRYKGVTQPEIHKYSLPVNKKNSSQVLFLPVIKVVSWIILVMIESRITFAGSNTNQ